MSTKAIVLSTSDVSPITPRLLTFKQAAAYLSCAVWQLRQLEWSGELPSVRNLGKRILFDIRDLDKLIEKKKAGR